MTSNQMYDAMKVVEVLCPEANMELIAVGLGAKRVYDCGDERTGVILCVEMPDGTGFTFN